MMLPRRYRLALRAYPAGYRHARGPELAATLADGDDDRGRPSTREAAALAGRGLAMRLGAAAAPDGLLVAAAGLVLVAMVGGFAWAERVFLLRGEAAAWGTDGPGWWWTTALGVSAFTALAAGLFRASESSRRRRVAVWLAVPLALVLFTAPGRIFYSGLPDAAAIVEFLKWAPPAVFHNWSLTAPATVAAVLGTWVALRALGRLGPAAKRRALAATLAILSAGAVAQSWLRPDLPAEYGRSAFADLGPATFMAALGLLLALAALWRLRPRPNRRPVAG